MQMHKKGTAMMEVATAKRQKRNIIC